MSSFFRGTMTSINRLVRHTQTRVRATIAAVSTSPRMPSPTSSVFSSSPWLLGSTITKTGVRGLQTNAICSHRIYSNLPRPFQTLSWNHTPFQWEQQQQQQQQRQQIHPTPLPHYQQSHQQQVRFMSWYVSRAARKRMPLTTKKARKLGFYKGKGSTSEGRSTSKGRFHINKLKRVQLVIPDLTGFKLKPYIAASAHKLAPENRPDMGRD